MTPKIRDQMFIASILFNLIDPERGRMSLDPGPLRSHVYRSYVIYCVPTPKGSYVYSISSVQSDRPRRRSYGFMIPNIRHHTPIEAMPSIAYRPRRGRMFIASVLSNLIDPEGGRIFMIPNIPDKISIEATPSTAYRPRRGQLFIASILFNLIDPEGGRMVL